MTNPINIRNTLTLYRYDETKPPSIWESNFRNPKYDSEIGHKNKFGLFFFTDSIDIATSLGEIHSPIMYYLTECKTVQSINILDFSFCRNIFQMIALMSDLGIYVLNDDFKTYSEKKPESFKRTFSELIPLYKQLLLGEGNIINFNLGVSDYEDVGLFGQRLTDFDNAEQFIKLTKHLGYDGYRWREFDEEYRGMTYCLFDAEKLSPPICKEISK